MNWKITAKDAKLIRGIVTRAEPIYQRNGVPFDRLEAIMDITACHANGTRLRLEDFLGAEDFDFAHDFFGIGRNIDRKTGKLRHCFLPRFAVRS
jgi:hypothetical protein